MGNEGKRDKLWTKNDKVFLGMLIPVLILFFLFNTLPLLKGFYYGLTNYRGYGDYDMVGLRNFQDLFTDLRVGKSYLFTFKYAVVMTILVNLISLILAFCILDFILLCFVLQYIMCITNFLYKF